LESGELELVLKNISFQIMKERMISQSCLSNIEKHEFIMRKGRDILYFWGVYEYTWNFMWLGKEDDTKLVLCVTLFNLFTSFFLF
jgi:hypothetical protein